MERADDDTAYGEKYEANSRSGRTPDAVRFSQWSPVLLYARNVLLVALLLPTAIWAQEKDPDALLSQALRRGDLYNWSDAEPLFAEDERYAKDIEKKISRKSIESLQAKHHCSSWRFDSRFCKGIGPWFWLGRDSV